MTLQPDNAKVAKGCFGGVLITFIVWIIVAIIFELIGWSDFL